MRVLFVDDDPNILAGLRRMLHSVRESWDVSFAGSGAEALALLENQPHDVVVSDMRMPGMDGAELLQEVRARYPQTVRVILSGHSDTELILRSVGSAHQYLTKPCQPEILKETIRRVQSISTLLSDERLRAVISRARELPSMPTLFTALMKEIKSPNSSINRIGQIVSMDPGMSAQVLRLVNSAFFGIRRSISNPAAGVAYLGLSTVTALVLSVHVFRQVDTTIAGWLGLDSLWRHGMNTGRLAKVIAEAERQDKLMGDHAISAGLLHDAGRLVMAANFPGPYQAAMELARQEGTTLIEAERKRTVANHAEVGAYLMGVWGLPTSIIEALAYHHNPSQCVHRDFCPLTAVHAACVLVREAQCSEGEAGGDGGIKTAGLDMEYLREVGVAERVPEWRRLRDQLDRTEEMQNDPESVAGR